MTTGRRAARRAALFVLYQWDVTGQPLASLYEGELDPYTQLYMYFPIGLTIFGVFGSFTYYLPELFPTRLRGTGAGFCYNTGRLMAAIGPFIVGSIAARGAGALGAAEAVLFYVGFVPLAGLLVMPWVLETKDRVLAD